MRTGRFQVDSMVSEGAWWSSSPLLLADLTATYHPIVEAPVSLRKFRRVGIIPSPVGTAVGCRETRSPMSKRENGSGMELGMETLARPPGFVEPHGHESHRGSSRGRIGAAGANAQAAEQVSSGGRGASHGWLGESPAAASAGAAPGSSRTIGRGRSTGKEAGPDRNERPPT